MFTEEQFKNLPSLRPDAHIKLVGLHQHQALSGCPHSIETSDGHFRVPRVLVPLVKRAMQELGCYDGPDQGPVNEVLRRIADGGRAEREDLGCDIAAAVHGIVGEAVAELKSRVVEAARLHSGDQRAALVAEAVRALAGV